jgi:sugar lactone lactonase YvrE
MPSRLRLLALCTLGAAFVAAAPANAAPRAVYAVSTDLTPGHIERVVTTYTVGADGSLTDFADFNSGSDSPRALAFAPDGRFAYVGYDGGGPGGIYVLHVEADGSLDTWAQVSTTSSATAIAVSPDGRFLYLGGYDGRVRTYAIGADGGLTPIGSPVAAGGADGIAVSPDGRHLYVADMLDSVVSTFALGDDGLPSGRVPTTVAGGNAGPTGLTITTAPRRLIVQDQYGANTVAFAINDNGSLGTAQTLDPGDSTSGPVAAGPVGAYSFVAGRRGPVKTFTNGVTMMQAASQPFAGHQIPDGGLAVAADGATLYVRDNTDHLIRRYGVADDGTLTEADAGAGVDLTNTFFGGLVVAPEQPPVASFTAELFGDSVTVDALASTDEGTVERYDWDFGDGTTAADAGPITTHDYAGPGTYTITVTETDDLGCSTTRTYTGSTVSCNGGPGARTTRTVTIPAPAGPAAPYVAPVTPAPAVPVAPSVAPVAPRVLPVLDGRGEGRVRATRVGGVTLPSLLAVCPAGAGPCDDATVAVNAEIRGRAVTLGQGTFRVADGARAEVSLTLSADGRKLLARARTLKVSAVVLLRNAASAAQAERVVTFTLLAPRVKR